MARMEGGNAISGRADEAGHTLPELLVALSLALMVAFGAMTIVTMAQRAEPRMSERAAQLQQGRAMIERIVRELRQGETVYNPTASSFEILTRVHGSTCGVAASTTIACRVIYECGSSSCSRTVRDPDGSGTAPPEQVVSGILGPSIFTYQTPQAGQPPDYVEVTLRFPSESGDETVTIADGAQLRNWTSTPS